MIENSAPGVQGAKSAGARAIGYLGGAHIEPDHGRRLLEAGADLVVEDWRAVARALISLAN